MQWKRLGKNSFNFEQLTTKFPEVEAMVNSIPLTYLSAGDADKEVLTPSHFLCARRIVTFSPEFVSRNETLRLWKRRQPTIDDFLKRWHKD